MAEVLDDLALAGAGGEHEGGALPIRDGQTETREHRIGDPHAVGALAPAVDALDIAGIDARPRHGIGPVFVASKDATERAHRFIQSV
ncbi:hypothetical protein D9M72_628780 [compost metagenome]